MIGKFIGKYLLRFFVVTLILVYGLSVVTEYNNLRPIVSDFSTKLVEGKLPLGINQDNDVMATINEYCKSNDAFVIQGYEGSPINCKDVKAKGAVSLSEIITDSMMKDYYKDYDCFAIGCLINIIYNKRSQDLMFIFSAEMNGFLKSIIPFLMLGTLLSIGIIINSIREKFESSMEIGVTLLGAAGIPFLILLILLYKDKILVSTGFLSGKEGFMRTTTDFFSGPIFKVADLYLYLYGLVFIIGGMLFIIGYYGYRRRP